MIFKLESFTEKEIDYFIRILSFIVKENMVHPTGDFLEYREILNLLRDSPYKVYRVIGEKLKNENSEAILFSVFSKN